MYYLYFLMNLFIIKKHPFLKVRDESKESLIELIQKYIKKKEEVKHYNDIYFF